MVICKAIGIEKHPNFNENFGWKLSTTTHKIFEVTYHTRGQDTRGDEEIVGGSLI